jgi:predicted DNA-binding protein
MSYIGQGLPADTFQGFTTDSFTGDGSATTFTLSKEPFSEDTLIVVINNVIQKPTTNFTVSGTTLTIVGTAVASGDVIYAIHTGGPLPIGESNKLDINGASDQLILDLDGDTTISADTDDQIDFKLGGSDIATLTTSSLTLKNSATADNSTFTLNLQTAESDIAADDVIGKIAFAAPNEGTGTDANLTAAAVQAVSEGDFSASSNASSLVFMTGSSAAATEVARFTSNGALLINTTNDGPASSVGGSGAYKKSLIIQDDVVGGTIYLGSNGSGDSSMLGGLHFFNSNNADEDASDADGQLVAFIRCRSVTSDNNAGDDSGAFLQFANSPEAGSLVETMRIDSSGNVLVAKTSASGGNTVGIQLQASGQGLFTRDGGTVMNVTRLSDDGELIKLIQDGSLEGTISVSGTTVTYGGFTGTHWSRLSNNSKPTILRGTIVETIDEMCDWYQAVADVAEVKYTAEDQEVISGDKNVGDVKEKAHQVKENIALPDGKSVGDAVTFTSDGTEYTGTIVKEDDVKHTKCKVSDTADSKKVYGVFSNWDDADDGLDGDVNDMEIAQVGTYIIRVNKDVTVEAGDLLVSNGDGTAKVQDDDIIRSKTVAKVNSNIKVETYSDGSYTVPCTLHC